jgi:hypothetical protein
MTAISAASGQRLRPARRPAATPLHRRAGADGSPPSWTRSRRRALARYRSSTPTPATASNSRATRKSSSAPRSTCIGARDSFFAIIGASRSRSDRCGASLRCLRISVTLRRDRRRSRRASGTSSASSWRRATRTRSTRTSRATTRSPTGCSPRIIAMWRSTKDGRRNLHPQGQPAGLGSHVANAAFMVAPSARGMGVGRRWASTASPKRGGKGSARCSSTSSSRQRVRGSALATAWVRDRRHAAGRLPPRDERLCRRLRDVPLAGAAYDDSRRAPRRARERRRRHAHRHGAPPPRGVPKSEYSTGNWYDVWLPNLAPTADSVKAAQAAASPPNGPLSRENTARKWPSRRTAA